MGREATCAWTYKRQTRDAALHLDGKRLDVRAGDVRARLDLDCARTLAVKDGALIVDLGPGERHAFALGAAAAKWLQAATTTKTVAQKLGIGPGGRVAFLGAFDARTIAELTTDAGAVRTATAKTATVVLALASDERATRKALTTFAALDGGVAVWMVFAKGRGVDFGETRVREIARASGFIDVKVVAFSATHSSLRFTRRASA